MLYVFIAALTLLILTIYHSSLLIGLTAVLDLNCMKTGTFGLPLHQLAWHSS